MRSSRTSPRVRAQAIGLTLLAHGLVALLLMELERRAPRHRDAPQLQYVSVWVNLPSEPQQSEDPARPVRTLKPAAPASTAIHIPEQAPAPQPAESPSSVTVDQQNQLQPPVDWNAAARDAAKRFAAGNGAAGTFSPPPVPQPKPCKPRKFDAQTEGLMAQRLPPPPDPEPVGADPKANCIVVGGFPKCVQKLKFGPRKRLTLSGELLAQRVEGKPPTSSVPSTEQCE
jgi:hypothetical protein